MMRPLHRTLVPAAVLAAALALAGAAPRAAAQAWTGAGAPVCTAPGQQSRVQVAGDGAGGAFVGWSDQRPGSNGTDVYLTRIGPDGAPAPGWPADGLLVCGAVGAQLLYSMAADGSGGVYLAWEDYRSGALSDVYGHHVLGDGLFAAGWPVDGLGIAVFMEEQRDPKLVSDGGAGVFAVWADARTYPFSLRDIYAQHLNPDGSRPAGWAEHGVRVTQASTYDYAPRAVADPDGGLYVTWTRGLSGQDVGAQHLGANGLPHPTWPDTGIVLCGLQGDQGGAALAPAPGGGALAVWKDQRHYTAGDTRTGHYALRFGPDTSRAAGWPRDGVMLYESVNGISAPYGADDGAGGMLYMWGELVSASDEDLFAMHVDSAGIVVTSVQFPDGIVALCPEPSYQHPVAFVSDGAGGAYAGWTDYRADPNFTNPDAYLQHVTATSAIAAGWPATGLALTSSLAPEGEPWPVAVPGGVIAAWSRGSGSAADVFASMVGLDGVVPALASLVSSEATSERVRVTWQVAGAAGGEWTVERRDEASSWTAIARAYPDGAGRVSVEDAAVVAGARYGYRLAPAAGGAAIGETWLEVPGTTSAFALRGVWPNPVAGAARVRFALPAAGDATLALLDPQGRRMREWPLGGAAGERELALDGLGRLAPGLYWLRLRQGAGEAAVRVVVVR